MRAHTLVSERRPDRPLLTVVPARGPGAPREDDGDRRVRDIYELWFADVVRWLYALGVPSSDTEDLAQEIFLVVQRKLNRFDGGNLAGWLYRIAHPHAAVHHVSGWCHN